MIFLGWVQWMALVKSQRKWIGPLIMQLIPWWSDVTRTIHLLGIHNSFSYWIRILQQFCNKSNLNFIFLSSTPFYMHQCACEDRLTTSTTWKSREQHLNIVYELFCRELWSEQAIYLPSYWTKATFLRLLFLTDMGDTVTLFSISTILSSFHLSLEISPTQFGDV